MDLSTVGFIYWYQNCICFIVQSIYRWTHHKLQQKVFLRIHDQKGLQNNILRIEENLDGRTSLFSAKSKMAAKT